MVTRKTVKSGGKVETAQNSDTSTEKFLRECAERAALPEPKKARKPKKSSTKKSTQKEGSSELGALMEKMSKRKLRKTFKLANPWLFRPEAIRKQIFTLVRKEHSFAFAKQLALVLSLSFKVSDHFEQLDAINPGLFKAQEDGTIELGIWGTISELNEAWKKLVEIQ